MLDPAQLAALAAIHRHGAFDLAAADLNVTPSAVSQRLKALEERVGTVLSRRGQPSVATEAGLRLIRHYDELALMERQLATDLPTLAAGPARLRIAVNADSLATWVLPALAAVDGFLFDLEVDDQDVSQDWLKRGAVAAAITGHPGPLQGCDTLALGALRYVATASPEFVARHLGQGLVSLRDAPMLSFNEKDRLQAAWLSARGLDVNPPFHRLASTQGFVEAARLGLGWGMNPEVLVRVDLAAGRLVALTPDAALDVPLYWQFSRIAAPGISALTQAIRAAAARVLIPPRT